MRKLIVVMCILLLLLPATNAQDITTVAGASTSITLSAPEDAAEPLTFIVDALPINGLLTGEAPNLVYQPKAGFVGTDTVTYTVIDGTGIVTTSTLVIQITEDETTSAPAAAVAIEPQTTVELEANSNVAFTIALGEAFELLVEPTHGTLSGQVPDIIYTPDEGFNGEDSFSYSVVIDGVEQTYEVTFAVGNVNGLVAATRPPNNYTALPGLSLALTELVRPSSLTAVRAEAASFVENNLVSVVVQASDSADAATSAITAAGGVVVSTATGFVVAEVPVSSLMSLGTHPSIAYIRLPQRFTTMGNVEVDRPASGLSTLSIPLETQSGTVTSEAVTYTNASAWHTAGYTGDGVKIGVIDYGFDDTGSYAADLGCLVEVKNANNTTYTTTGSDDGIPALETICDMAPDAEVYARHVADESQFYTAMDNLAALNVDIIYAALQPLATLTSTDPLNMGDGSSPIDAKVDTIVGVNDILVVVPSGDNHDSNYEGPLDLIMADINGDGSVVEMVHTFDGEISGWGTDVFNKLLEQDPFDSELDITSGSLTFVLTWKEGMTTPVELDLTLYKYNTTSSAWEELVSSKEDAPPTREILTISYNQLPIGRYRLAIVAAGSGNPEDYEDNQWIQLTELRNNIVIFQDRYKYSSIIAPATSQTAFTVGAFYQADASTRTLDTFSAHGPANTQGGGDPFAAVGGYFQPQIVAQNGTDVSYGGAYTGGFNGTRAAAAHAAGAAALVKELNPSYTRIDLGNDLRTRALLNSGDPGAAGPDTAYGYGFLYLGNPTDDASCDVDTIGIYRDSDFSWYLRNSNTSGFAQYVFNYGLPSDQSITGDWDGDGDDTVGIYRNGTFFLKNTNTTGVGDVTFAFGAPTDIPIAGDWNGDGIDTVGLYRPSSGSWFLIDANESRAPDYAFTYGLVNETPVTGDWNGDGNDTIGIFRASDSTWYLRNSNSAGFAESLIVFGNPATDNAITGDWNGDCVDTIGLYRRAEANWFLKNTNSTGIADVTFTYGLPNETPVSGDWDNN
ncbi:MAG: hypothetical protein CL607_26335 [Anaerolineaceae bacterium]|nr:hypothetical protein [Anaerolineaceae bacterium]